MKKISEFLSENFQFLVVKFSIYLNRRVFVMGGSFSSGSTSSNFLLLILIPRIHSKKFSLHRHLIGQTIFAVNFI